MKRRRREKTNTCCHSRLHYWIWRWSCWIANEQLLKLRKTMLVQRRCCWSWSCGKLRWEEVHDGRCRGWCWTAAGVEEVTLAAGEEMHCQCRRWWMLQMRGGGSRFFFRFPFVCMAGSWCEQEWVRFLFYYKRGKADRASVIGLALQQLQEWSLGENHLPYKKNSTHVIWPLFFNIKQNTSFLIKKNKLLLLKYDVLFK